MNAPGYNFAYLDEQTKRMIRRAILKAIAIPGYQVPFASREMPMPYGWGTGGIQITASISGNKIFATFNETGTERTSAGTFVWTYQPETNSLSGTFSSTAADSRGSSVGERVDH